MTREQLAQVTTVEDLLRLKLEIFSVLESNRNILTSLRSELQQAGVVPSEKLQYSAKEFAFKLGVSTRTVKNWIYDGILEASQPNGFRGSWIIPASELKRLFEAGYSKTGTVQ